MAHRDYYVQLGTQVIISSSSVRSAGCRPIKGSYFASRAEMQQKQNFVNVSNLESLLSTPLISLSNYSFF